MNPLGAVVDALVIFAPTGGYIAQIHQTLTTRKVQGYSINVSMILLACNWLRVLYWVGERFATALLLQSMWMILVQVVLVCSVLNVSDPSGEGRRMRKPASFVLMYSLTAVVSYVLLSPVLLEGNPLVAVLGFLALGVEATLLIPQIKLNYDRKGVDGISLLLLATWFLGDIIKTVYFIALRQPWPFLMCAGTQLSLDGVLALQLLLYRERNAHVDSDVEPA